MEDKIICKFKITKQIYYDYYKTLTSYKIGKYINLIMTILTLSLLICLIILKQTGMLIPIVLILFVALLAVCLFAGNFAYLPLVYKSNHKKIVKTCGITENNDGSNEILFDDNNIVFMFNNRKMCVPYTLIKNIEETSSAYLLRVNGMSGIMIPKGSGVNADDEEILVFLINKIGHSFSGKKSALEIIMRVITTIVASSSVLLVAFTWLILGTASWTIRGDENDYLSSYITEDNILDTAGDYEDAYFQEHNKKEGPFGETARLLKLDYSSENYYKQVDFINSNYNFLDEPKGSLLSQNEFDIGDWHFKVCEDYDYYGYPDFFRTIGFNEKSKSIVYIDFEAPDLDYLCETYEPMEECLIDEYVGYNFKKN